MSISKLASRIAFGRSLEVCHPASRRYSSRHAEILTWAGRTHDHALGNVVRVENGRIRKVEPTVPVVHRS
jgi:hypothetical protein